MGVEVPKDEGEKEPDPDPDLGPEPGWEPARPMERADSQPVYVSGDPHGDRIRVRYYRRPDDDVLLGKIWLGKGAEGPPGHAHGGSTAAIFDEAMGFTCWMNGYQVVAASITVHFRRLFPLYRVVRLEAAVERSEGRKVYTRGALTDEDGVPFAEAEGLYIHLTRDRFTELLEGDR